MQVRTIRRTLQVTSAVFCLTAAVILVYGLWGPLRLAEPTGGWRPRRTAETSSLEHVETPSPAWDQSSSVWDKPLRAIFAKRNAKKKARPGTAGATRAAPRRLSLPVKLIGTIVEPGRPFAVFVDAQGRCEVRGLGERIRAAGSSAEVIEIRRDGVVIRWGGRTVTLKLPTDKPKWWR